MWEFIKALYWLVKSFGGLAFSIFLWFLLVPEHNGWFHEYLPWVRTDWLFWFKVWFWCYVDWFAAFGLAFVGIDIFKGMFKG